jgi:hypothetical protein
MSTPEDALKTILENKLSEAFSKLLPEELARFIPVECWRESIKISINSFFDKKNNSQYRETQSRFDQVVWQILQEETKKQLADYFNSSEWCSEWNDKCPKIKTQGPYAGGTEIDLPGFKQLASESVKKIVAENMTTIVTNMVGGQIQTIIDNLRYNIQQGLNR